MADASNEIQAQALVKNTPDERRSVQTSFAPPESMNADRGALN